VPWHLAWRNATREKRRCAVTLVGVAIAVFLMVFQLSLLVGFIEATGKVVTAADGDVWIVPRGVPCFDFSARLPTQYLDLAAHVDGVAAVLPIVSGFTTLRRPDGGQQAVLLVGGDPRLGPHFPLPRVTTESGQFVLRDGVVADVSNLASLGLTAIPAAVEIGSVRADVIGRVRGFGTFLGSPYVFGTVQHARDVLRISDKYVSFGVVRFASEPDSTQLRALRDRLPHADVLTEREFKRQSSVFWLVQTGAGGAIVVGAVLGLAVGLVIVLQTMYANIMESLDEFATLKALGATSGAIRGFVALQAIALGCLGTTLGLIATFPLTAVARTHLVSWIVTPVWLRAAAAVIGIGVSLLAAMAASQPAIRVDPMRVLRG
jgi:putative ABC transport system permease protein